MSHINPTIYTLLLLLLIMLPFVFVCSISMRVVIVLGRNGRMLRLPSDGGGGQIQDEADRQANRERYHFI